MAVKPQLFDAYGRPIERATFKAEIAAAKVGTSRSPIAGYPGDGLDPVRLATILRQADAGDPVQQMELAETIEERDLHYQGVLGTRRRTVSQIDITVEAASDAAADIDRADLVRDWLTRDELQMDLFDILDCIGKGWSFTEIVWDTSEGQWQPGRLELRDPRWFRPADHDLATPMMLDDNGQKVPLPGMKFIHAQIKAKSGLPLRSGLMRAAAWAWMFKSYTQRDWAIFTQTYGQPVRVGKYGSGASEEEKDTLFGAVANIAGDCAAIIPDSMSIEFIQAMTVSASSDLYRDRADWLDRQVSKAVLGQTATTDAVTGGMGSGKEHRQVQEDIERADAKALSAIVNRDLIRSWMQLEFGPLPKYPRLKIERPEHEDVKALTEAVARLVPLGFRVGQSTIRDKLGLPDPGDDDLLRAPVASSPPAQPEPPVTPAPRPALQQAEPEHADTDLMADRLATEAAPEVGAMIGRIEGMLAAATSLEEFAEMLRAGFWDLDESGLRDALAQAMTAAHGYGRARIGADSA